MAAPNMWLLRLSRIYSLDCGPYAALNGAAIPLRSFFFRDLLYYKITGVDDEIIFKNQMGKIDKLSKAYPEGDWQACIQHIENTQNYILRNGYLPLMITNLMIDIHKALQGKFHKPFQLSDWTPV